MVICYRDSDDLHGTVHARNHPVLLLAEGKWKNMKVMDNGQANME